MSDELRARLDKSDGKLEMILDILKGKEGEPGLCEKQRDVEKRVERLEEKPVKVRTIIAWTIGAVVGIVNITVLVKSFFMGK